VPGHDRGKAEKYACQRASRRRAVPVKPEYDRGEERSGDESGVQGDDELNESAEKRRMDGEAEREEGNTDRSGPADEQHVVKASSRERVDGPKHAVVEVVRHGRGGDEKHRVKSAEYRGEDGKQEEPAPDGTE
jgi:hypothetical protein